MHRMSICNARYNHTKTRHDSRSLDHFNTVPSVARLLHKPRLACTGRCGDLWLRLSANSTDGHRWNLQDLP